MEPFEKCALCIYYEDRDHCPTGGRPTHPAFMRCDHMILRYGQRKYRDPSGDREWQNPHRQSGLSNTRRLPC